MFGAIKHCRHVQGGVCLCCAARQSEAVCIQDLLRQQAILKI